MHPNKQCAISNKFLDFFLKFVPYALQAISNHDGLKVINKLMEKVEELRDLDSPKLTDLTSINKLI